MAVARASRERPYRWEYGKLIPRAVIRDYARQIAAQFHPDRIILFGSYAYGRPRPDSDVDLLVIMPTRNQIAQAIRIDEAIEPGFFLDLIVRTPKTLERRLRWGDWFLREIVTSGKVLYEKADGRVARQGRGRSRHRPKAAAR